MLERFPRTLQAARKVLDLTRLLDPARRRRERLAMAARLEALSCLDRLSRQTTDEQRPRARNVLIDGIWDNPNYWIRYALVRRALGLAQANETGLLGQYSRSRVKASFAAIGIEQLADYPAATRRSARHFAGAKALLSDLGAPGDLLQLKMPNGFPAALVFDAILKRQRRATVNLRDPELPGYLAEVLAYIEAADHIVGEGKFDLVVLSHALDYTYSAIAWAAIRRSIPVLVLYGDYGTARFLRLREATDLFAYPGRPTIAELEGMPSRTQALLREQGAAQLHARLSGQTDDVGAVFAYQKRSVSVDKAILAERFDWDPSKPVIGVYNSNWFDYPHASGLREFRDFLDWIEQTLAVACTNDSVNWLFKAHPCDDWYASIKGTRLEDLVADARLRHIQLADKSWNGLDLIRTLDGIVTCHGTIGIEATSLGKPVLVPYAGWYGQTGFVINPGGRGGYLAALKKEWWKSADTEAGRARAELFAGWMFCVPDWHGCYILQDDSRQDAIYSDLPGFLESNGEAIEKEVREISNWFDSGHNYLHVFKMSRADGFQLAKLKQSGPA